jgi:hypothetical protein
MLFSKKFMARDSLCRNHRKIRHQVPGLRKSEALTSLNIPPNEGRSMNTPGGELLKQNTNVKY